MLNAHYAKAACYGSSVLQTTQIYNELWSNQESTSYKLGIEKAIPSYPISVSTSSTNKWAVYPGEAFYIAHLVLQQFHRKLIETQISSSSLHPFCTIGADMSQFFQWTIHTKIVKFLGNSFCAPHLLMQSKSFHQFCKKHAVPQRVNTTDTKIQNTKKHANTVENQKRIEYSFQMWHANELNVSNNQLIQTSRPKHQFE